MKTIVLILSALILGGCVHSPSVMQAIHQQSAHRTSLSSIDHIVILEMENRSFDEMFGTYPGVNGIPSDVNCNPDLRTHECIYPYHETSTVNHGGPHDPAAERGDLDGGKLDGFVSWAQTHGDLLQADELMGYHTCAELPVYCDLASQGILADNFFAATTSYSTVAHTFLVSGWNAACSSSDPMSCISSNSLDIPNNPEPDLAWTDITWLLNAHHVSWGYYVYDTKHPFLQPNDDPSDEPGPNEEYNIPGPWNPLPLFDDVNADGQISNIQPGKHFEANAAAGTLPAVSFVIPSFKTSDHPSADLADGQKWVRRMVNAVRSSPNAGSTLIIIQWDEWGDFYDHVIPPIVDGLGYGFRVPMIMLGPMVKPGIDHQLLSSDAELKLIEDIFLGSARIDSNDGRPDSRPDVRENTPGLGDLRLDIRQ